MISPTFLLVLAVAMVFASGYLAAYVANEKGYNATMWFLGGLFFSIPALIAVAGLPDRRKAPFDDFKSNLPKLD